MHAQAMGGAKYIYLTHRDDVAEHAKWAKALGAERIMHIGETNAEQGTECVSEDHLFESRFFLACNASHWDLTRSGLALRPEL